MILTTVLTLGHSIAGQGTAGRAIVADYLGAGLPAQTVPNPGATAPPGQIGDKINSILGWMKYLALAACAAAFIGGIIAFTAGRVVDNRRYGNTGALMMIAAVGGALAFGVGPAILNAFAAG